MIEDLDLPHPVIRSHYGHGFAKQYVRDDRWLRTEPATNNVYDYGVKKDVENLPKLRERMSGIIETYHNVQQDILETLVDRGQLRKLAQPTVLPNGKRIPGLKLDHPRQLAVMHSLVRFAHVAAGGDVTTADLYAPTLDALGLKDTQYSLAALRYDLAKLRAKGLLEKSHTPATIGRSARATRFVWSSSSSSRKSTRHSRRACWHHFAATPSWPRRSAANSTACTNPSLTVWMRSCAPSVSRSLLDRRKREQNSRWGPYNGNS